MAQGVALREKVHGAPAILAGLYGFRALQPSWLPYVAYRRIAEGRAMSLLEPALKRDSPEAWLHMSGIAQGAQVTLRLLCLLHALEPMLSDVCRCSATPALGACSAVAVRGTRSALGEPVIARNFDYLKDVQPLYCVRESRPKGGFRSLDFTLGPFAGTVDGVNERGLCITYDYAYSNDYRGDGAAPISLVIAEALQRCATVKEAAEWIRSRPRWGGGILMLADAEGDLASLELSNTRSAIRRPASGSDVLCHTNAFTTDSMRGVEIPADARYTDRVHPLLRGRRVHESANVRDRRLQELLSREEPLDLAGLAAIMSDHETGGAPGDTGICKHSEYWSTTASVQLLPVSRRMRIAFDSACHANYVELAL